MFSRLQAGFPLVLSALAFAGCNHISIDDVSKIQGHPVERWEVSCPELYFVLDKEGLRGVVDREASLGVSGDLFVENGVLYGRFKFDGAKKTSYGMTLVDYEGVVDVNLEEPGSSRGYLIKVIGDEYQFGTDKLEGMSCETTPQLDKAALERIKGSARQGS